MLIRSRGIGQAMLMGTVAVTLFVCAGVSPAQNAKEQDTKELVIDQIKKTVVFLEGTFPGREQRQVNGVVTEVPVTRTLTGTGFIVFVGDPRLAVC